MSTMDTKLDRVPTLPQYSETPQNPFSSIHRVSTSSSSSTTSARSATTAPPPYDSSTQPPFVPTIELRIETPGKPLISLPTPPRPDPIPIYADSSPTPKYLSLRPTRSSGSCYLISPSSSSAEDEAPLSTTTYRFGPGRPPVINLYLPGTCGSVATTSDSEIDLSTYASFPITSPSVFSRSTTFTTPVLGTFAWRYATRAERHAHGGKPNSVLVLEKISLVSEAYATSKATEVRTVVAKLVRGEGTRSSGSSSSSAGNGGVLVVDLRGFESRGEGDEKETERRKEMGLVTVVTTALVMLKKEVDRRRAQQIAVLSGAV